MPFPFSHIIKKWEYAGDVSTVYARAIYLFHYIKLVGGEIGEVR